MVGISMFLSSEHLCYNDFMLMHKIVPEQKMARFYEVHVQSTLLDSHAVVCTWGSIKNGYHRVRMIKTQTKEEAEKIADRIIRQKTKKGYKGPDSYQD
jgi:predicted DNA-binding WGR domain protein